jgi:hypothetical protein
VGPRCAAIESIRDASSVDAGRLEITPELSAGRMLAGAGAWKDCPIMSRSSSRRRRPSVRITLPRAARLHRLVRFLAEAPRERLAILSELRIGLRTFYREWELLTRCGVKVRQRSKLYFLGATAEQAEGRLPCPDPQLSFGEVAELAECDCAAGRRLAALLAEVIQRREPPKER